MGLVTLRTLPQGSCVRSYHRGVSEASPVPRVRVGVIIQRPARPPQTLLLRRRNVHGDGTWSSPCGHLAFGESPAAYAIRAACETGLRVENVDFLGVTNDVYDRDQHYVTLWFVNNGFSGNADVSVPSGTIELEWFAFDELPEALFPPLHRVLMGAFYVGELM